MLKTLTQWFLCAFFFLLLLFASAWLATFSPSYQECESKYGEKIKADPSDNAEELFKTRIGEFLSCEAAFANENGDATTGIATVLLALITAGLVWLAIDQSQTGRAQLRAYVKLSHRSPGVKGLDGVGISHITGSVTISIEARNSGHTPASVTDILLKTFMVDKGVELPKKPDYSMNRPPHDATRGFLVANDVFVNHRQFFIPAEHFPSITDGSKILFVIGYVDYIDIFNRRHRGGYARVYDPRIDKDGYPNLNAEPAVRNNLVFISNAGYNYDRLRTRREGKDWRET